MIGVVIALVIIVLFLLFFGPFSAKVIKAIFYPGSYCEDSVEFLENIDFQIKASMDDKSEKIVLIDTQDGCSVIGFDKDQEEDLIIRPDSCFKKSCLCLSYQKRENDCKEKKFCKYYPDKNLKGDYIKDEFKDLVYIESGIRSLNITYEPNTISIKEIKFK